jgi:hypothetical protein
MWMSSNSTSHQRVTRVLAESLEPEEQGMKALKIVIGRVNLKALKYPSGGIGNQTVMVV